MPRENNSYDAVVVGAGANGLAAAIRLAQEGFSTLVIERNSRIGGSARSEYLTLPGFLHDVCSAVHPLAVASPFLASLGLQKFGLEFIQPELPLAHTIAHNFAVGLHRSVAETAADLASDAISYRRLFEPLVTNLKSLTSEFLRPVLHLPRDPWPWMRFSVAGLAPANFLAKRLFAGEPARALFAGLAAHGCVPLEAPGTAGFGIVLGMLGHGAGWPIPRGGTQAIANALAALLQSLGGKIETGIEIRRLEDLPPARAVLLDVTPHQFVQMAGDRLPTRYRRRLQRFRYGPGVFKIDYALKDPIPWSSEICRRAGTIHLGGTLQEVVTAERGVSEDKHPEEPFVLLVQPTIWDPTRAPSGCHVAWAYCHVPNGSSLDMTGRIERQIERFAPGFRDCVLSRHIMLPADLEKHNPNLVGGSISGGASDIAQLIARPVLSFNPYRTALPGVYLCSSSTPPGPGVHGMCGFHAATTVLRDVLLRNR